MTEEKEHYLTLFIFRRDLRVEDNTALIEAMIKSNSIIPLFICTPTQLAENKYKSSNAIQFMMDSLYDLDNRINQIKQKCNLWITYGHEIDIIKKIHSKMKLSAIYFNKDYTPYSIYRDKLIEKYCIDNEIYFESMHDVLLLDTLDIKTNNNTYYSIFTQFYKKNINNKIRKPDKLILNNFEPITKLFDKWRIDIIDNYLLKKKYYQLNEQIALAGGRYNGLKILSKIGQFKNYHQKHDMLTYNTTKLSAHNKFGTVSVREVYYAFKSGLGTKGVDLCKQLYWRDFYYYVGYHFKKFYRFEHLKRSSNKKIVWDNNKMFLKAWQEGMTGFPIIDAAMTELNTTGFMHNRGRLITASFLVKDLLVDWKYGEIYFSKKLVDCDYAQNTGNWNWSSSFGLDSTPFLRILNPWEQSKKYDPNCEYIKKWLPELANIPANHLHSWDKYFSKYPDINYPEPIVDHRIQRTKFIQFYKKYFS